MLITAKTTQDSNAADMPYYSLSEAPETRADELALALMAISAETLSLFSVFFYKKA